MTKREEFSAHAPAELLSAMRKVARDEGRHFHDVLEDAMREYLDGRARQRVRPEIMAHFYASLERNHRLGELLSES